MFTKQERLQQQRNIEQQRLHLATYSKTSRQPLLHSWQRSAQANIPKERFAAPLCNQVHQRHSILNTALQQCGKELDHIAQQSSMVIAIGDSGSTIIWTAASRQMQSAAEKVHFIAGGQWHEELVGTNALALSLKTQQSSCVFSNEHYMESIHDWVCYAAPILHPYSQQVIGVIDLSTTANQHNSLGVLAAERCATIIQNALLHPQKPYLYIRALNTAQISLNGKNLILTPRQIEILSILALCPQGLNLEQLHQALYGERKVSMGTLKAEMSQLRDILGGLLGSRPYRLLTEVEGDFLHVEQALDAGYLASALQFYSGIFLAKSESPFLSSWRDYLESRLSHAIFNIVDTDILLKHISRQPEAIHAIEHLIQLLPETHPARHYLLPH